LAVFTGKLYKNPPFTWLFMCNWIRSKHHDAFAKAPLAWVFFHTDMMTTPSSSLELRRLRQEIDRLDEQLHDLLLARAHIVGQIATLKGAGAPVLRPAREAQILRRIIARHRGEFSPLALAHIWREIIAASSLIQGPCAVAVLSSDGEQAWPNGRSLARDHYGSATPLIPVSSALAALRAVSDGQAALALLPWPQAEVDTPWWPSLCHTGSGRLNIVAALPFLSATPPQALAIGITATEPSGEDHTFLALEIMTPLSRARLKGALEKAGLPILAFYLNHGGQDGGETGWQMVEIADWVDMSDARLTHLATAIGPALDRVMVLGHYAVPIKLTSSS
jgi:chorismate mutase / prephenate dehydratase